ncbi:MAG: hypothetical protein K9L85_02580 [Candidatus Peribacteraceae bacterium]|nr:hypothetical protein [Candidatus Peribacteraceae bacterium]
MKKALLAIIAIIVLGGVAFAAKIAIDRPNDPQNFVNTALANSFVIDSAKFQSSIQITGDAGGMGNGQLALAISGSVANATEYLPTLDYQIDLEALLNFGEQTINALVSGDLRILDEVFYGQISNFSIEGAEGLVPTEMIEPFVNKWYALSFADLKNSDPEIAAVFEEQKAQQMEMRENLKNILANNNVVLVKKMPISFGERQPVEVVLNTDLVTSDEFLTEMEKIFTPASLPEGAENPLALTEEQKVELRAMLSEIGSKIDSTITLSIGKDDGILHGYTAVLNFDLAELGLPIESGRISVVLNSEITDINQPQLVEAPADFEEIDPLALAAQATTEDEPLEELSDEELIEPEVVE